MITLLQHTHPSLPHYNDKEWEWLRGALSTVDRSYGLLDIVFHHIADTHVCHHLFSAMPHYHAQVGAPLKNKLVCLAATLCTSRGTFLRTDHLPKNPYSGILCTAEEQESACLGCLRYLKGQKLSLMLPLQSKALFALWLAQI